MKDKSILFGFCLVAFAVSAAAQTVTGSGTTNTVPVFTGTSTVGNSPISVSGSNVGIGTTNPAGVLQVRDGPNNNIRFFAASDFGSAYSGMGMQAINDAANTAGMIVIGGNPTVFVSNVGIGTTSPAYSLDVAGTIRSTSGGVIYPDATSQTTAWTGVLCGGDYAEDMRADQKKESYEPGDVLVLTSDDNSDVQKSVEPYSTMVAGIYATKPGVVGLRDAVAKSPDNVPMAMVGVVPTKVTAENGPIRKGDLLVTSSLKGYAMKGTDRSRMLGAVIGKAMGSLDSGTGVIEALVTLQ